MEYNEFHFDEKPRNIENVDLDDNFLRMMSGIEINPEISILLPSGKILSAKEAEVFASLLGKDGFDDSKLSEFVPTGHMEFDSSRAFSSALHDLVRKIVTSDKKWREWWSQL